MLFCLHLHKCSCCMFTILFDKMTALLICMFFASSYMQRRTEVSDKRHYPVKFPHSCSGSHLWSAWFPVCEQFPLWVSTRGCWQHRMVGVIGREPTQPAARQPQLTLNLLERVHVWATNYVWIIVPLPVEKKEELIVSQSPLTIMLWWCSQCAYLWPTQLHM